MSDILFFALGLAAGIVGTLIGAGGGFMLAPIFLFLFPNMDPVRLTALSLLAVSANSTSGSISYAFRRQVHWPSVFLFTLVAFPGVWLGLQLNRFVDRHSFESIFSIFLLSLGAFIIWRSFRKKHEIEIIFWNFKNKILGGLASFFVGIVSSLLGLGGGIIHVPLLAEFLGYPVHIAAGTSHAILSITSIFAVSEHFFKGDYHDLESWVPWLVVGLVTGAQIGAALSKKMKSKWIMRLLGAALFSVAVRLILKNL
jgi:uncharacterized membrane protein YfcA